MRTPEGVAGDKRGEAGDLPHDGSMYQRTWSRQWVPTAANPHQRPTSGCGAPVRVVRHPHRPLHAHVPQDPEPAGRARRPRGSRCPPVPAHVVSDAEPDPGAAAAAVIRSASAAVVAIGFSQNTCLPASAAAMHCPACSPSADAISTASRSGSASRASRSGVRGLGGRGAVALGEIARASRIAAQHTPQLRAGRTLESPARARCRRSCRWRSSRYEWVGSCRRASWPCPVSESERCAATGSRPGRAPGRSRPAAGARGRRERLGGAPGPLGPNPAAPVSGRAVEHAGGAPRGRKRNRPP